MDATEFENDKSLDDIIKATASLQKQSKRELLEYYSRLRNEREKATFSMMMRMNPRALTNIRKEFFLREDALELNEFLFVINKHLVNKDGSDDFIMETPEQREFGTNMFELFKDIDVNGDGDLEWQEFTTFVVEKANLLNKRAKAATIAHYHDSTRNLDPSAEYRHRNDISKMVNIPALNQFCIAEDAKRSIWVFNSRLGKHIATIHTDSAPIAMSTLGEQSRGTLVASFSDMTIATYSLDEPSLTRRYKQLATFATPGVQMALQYAPASGLLYSGATNGDVYSWKMEDRKMVKTLSGHTDIVMSLCLFDKLNYVASGSLDRTISLWDTYTDSRIVHYHGHKKGILELAYNSDYRLMFSCGFEHDCLVWSPFVNGCVYRLKGHHGALIGVQCVPNTPEVITADVTGVFKLWDVRKFECVQTFGANLSGTDGHQENDTKSHLCCFLHTNLPARNSMQKEDDSRIIGASKLVFSFDQARVVHQATTDYFNIINIFWVPDSCCFVTVSEKNVIVWDALIGCKNVINANIIDGFEVTCACLDDRKRKMVIGDVRGTISVYNHLNGQFMKSTSGIPNPFPVIALEYLEESRRFIAGYSNGMVRVYDENAMEDCCVVRTLGSSVLLHPEMIGLAFNPIDRTLVTAGGSLACFWDYDASKVEYELPVCPAAEAVVWVGFFHPLPLVATSDSTGNITLWGSRGNASYQGMRLAGFLNQTVPDAQLEMRPPKNFLGKEEAKPLLALPPFYEPDPFPLSEGAPKADTNCNDNTALKNKEDAKQDDGQDEAASDEDSKAAGTGHPTASPPQKRKKDPNEFDASLVDEELRAKGVAQADADFERSENIWGRVLPAGAVAWEETSMKVFTGDDLGTLRCFDISHFLADAFAAYLPNSGIFDDTIRGLCAARGRNKASAMAPFAEKGKILRYQLADINKPNAYHGVDFVWAIESAHADRIVTCKTTSQGVLTSGADKLVKMWGTGGHPIGVLLQSVPTGQPSSQWDLDHDVQGIMAREEGELDELIENVKELAAPSTEKPNVWEADVAGMDPGPGSADFTRSELRQRIDQTSQNLGLDFPVEEDADEDEEEEEASPPVRMAIGVQKTLSNALKELRSTTRDEEDQSSKKSGKISEVARRRQEKKFEDISLRYEPIAGVKIVAGQTSFGGKDEDQHLDAIISVTNTSKPTDDIFSIDDMYSMGSSVGPEVVDIVLKTKRSAGSKLNAAIDDAGQSGKRSMAIAKKCKKFGTYCDLEKSLVDDPLVLMDKKMKKAGDDRTIKISKKMAFLLGDKSDIHVETTK